MKIANLQPKKTDILLKQIKFFTPLGMTSILIVITHSLFNMALARFPTPEVYISAFAVAKSFMH